MRDLHTNLVQLRSAALHVLGPGVIVALLASSVSTLVVNRVALSDDILAEAEGLDFESRTAREGALGRAERDAGARERDRDQARAAGLEPSFELDHNIFCPACSSTPAEPDQASTAPTNLPVAPTQLPLVLLATMIADEPEASMATVLDTERSATGIFSVGERVRGGATVVSIHRQGVVLNTQSGLERLGLPKPEDRAKKPQKPKKGKKKRKKSKRKKNKREIPGAREAIECKGNACVVERSFVEKVLADPQLLVRQARMVPAVRNGDVEGFKVYGIRNGTLPKLLGLRNGDVLESVNGNELDSMDGAMGLYRKLRHASELRVTVKRKGKVFDKQISIR